MPLNRLRPISALNGRSAPSSPAAVISTALGITAGYRGGWVDALIMRLVDISLSIPIILLGLAIMLVALSMNLLGDWLRDRLDPKQRQV